MVSNCRICRSSHKDIDTYLAYISKAQGRKCGRLNTIVINIPDELVNHGARRIAHFIDICSELHVATQG